MAPDGANLKDHQRLETQKPVRWPPAKRDGRPTQTVKQMPDADRRHDRRRAAKDDSCADSLAVTLTRATTKNCAIGTSEASATGA